MGDRLKQIWAGFEATTSRRLTGRGVENIVVPHRHDWRAEDEQFLAEGFSPPAAAAFEALRGRLAESERQQRKKDAGRHLRAGDAPPMAEPGVNGDLRGAKDLVRGLMATEARVARSEYDYADFLAEAPVKKGLFGKPRRVTRAGRRKKFLGIF